MSAKEKLTLLIIRIISVNLIGFILVISLVNHYVIDEIRGEIRDLQEENAEQLALINTKPSYPVSLAETVLTLQAEVEQLKNKPASGTLFNLGTMSDRLAGASQDIETLKKSDQKQESALYTHAQGLQTGATLLDARNNFFAKIILAEQLLAAGKPDMAKLITMTGVTDLSIASCGKREAEIAIWLMPDSLLQLVQADMAPLYTFQADPARNAMKITWTNPTPGC